jgi:hypothetical protein
MRAICAMSRMERRTSMALGLKRNREPRLSDFPARGETVFRGRGVVLPLAGESGRAKRVRARAQGNAAGKFELPPSTHGGLSPPARPDGQKSRVSQHTINTCLVMIFFCFWPVSRPFGLNADEGSLYSPTPDIASRLGEVFRAPKEETSSNGYGLPKTARSRRSRN